MSETTFNFDTSGDGGFIHFYEKELTEHVGLSYTFKISKDRDEIIIKVNMSTLLDGEELKTQEHTYTVHI